MPSTLAKLMDVPNGGHPGIWVKTPDGEGRVQVGVRPATPRREPRRV